MKALSMKQPVPELILQKKKTIELRKWNTKFRGKFLLHASLGEIRSMKDKHLASEDWFVPHKTFGFILKNPERLSNPIKIKGQLYFFEVNI